jgi:hypothetical protein
MVSELLRPRYGCGFACAMMNDTTPKQIAAAKATVIKGDHIWT